MTYVSQSWEMRKKHSFLLEYILDIECILDRIE
jgi:hypothetical protein